MRPQRSALVCHAAPHPQRDRRVKLRLAQWQAAAVMSRVVDDTMERIGFTNLFNQGGLAFLRDAWIAAEFGKLRKAECVRLVADTWPDFELAIAGATERFEAVEADDPARRRGDEYRNSAGRARHDRWKPGLSALSKCRRGFRPHVERKPRSDMAGPPVWSSILIPVSTASAKGNRGFLRLSNRAREGCFRCSLGALEEPGVSRLARWPACRR